MHCRQRVRAARSLSVAPVALYFGKKSRMSASGVDAWAIKNKVLSCSLFAVGVRNRNGLSRDQTAQKIVVIQVEQQPARHGSHLVDAAGPVNQEWAWCPNL